MDFFRELKRRNVHRVAGFATFTGRRHRRWTACLPGAKEQLEIVQREQPRNHFLVRTPRLAEAGLGNKEAALREEERAMMLMPASEDPVYGPIAEETLAAIEAQAGDPDPALARIERLLTTPCGAYPVTQATLRIDPIWDPLREHPRFKAIVEGPEPVTIYN